ncbi:MFS transporter [Microlunatus sp. Y2014]|uniref:MFS transporter n=1 Tax=Microlunatus sp. Y2014 TaxID=3418488 RepID=UPI003DA745F8
MALTEYRSVLGVPGARQALLIGLLIRVPMTAANVLLVLHVVQSLQMSYAAAGVVSATYTIALAISGPWRGRVLDRYGLRRTVLPCVIVGAACWAVAPWVGYVPLLVLVAVAGLFLVPTFGIIRQWLIASTSVAARKTAMVLDSVAAEAAFMIGPAIGVVFAVAVDTRIALLAAQALSLVGGLLLFMINPPQRHRDETTDDKAPISARVWVTPVVVALLAAGAASTIVLTAGDVGVVAAMREMGYDAQIGLVLAVWGLGSVIGGLAYGAMRRTIPVFWLLLGLGVTTVPIAFAQGPISFCVLLFVSGLLCAPTIAATTDHLSRVVPARVRGEALGWHGSSMTSGSALGAPLAGITIDRTGWQGAFVVNAAIGIAVAVAGLVVLAVRERRRRGAAGVDSEPPTHELPTPVPSIEDTDEPIGYDLGTAPGDDLPPVHR